MSEYIGNRIVPRHDGVWDKAKEYEPLTIVYEESTGDSYMSRKPVPAGTLLSQEEYWAMCSRFSEQMALYRQNTAEEVEQFRKDTAADVEQLRTDTASDVAVLRKMTAQDVADITQKVDAANSAVAASKSEMDKTAEMLKAQINANVKASTDKNANYAQELVDARVDDEGKTYPTAGDNIRAVGRVRSMQNIMKNWVIKNGYANQNGNLVASESWRVAHMVPVSGDAILVDGQFGYMSGRDDYNNVVCYDMDRKFLGGCFRAEDNDCVIHQLGTRGPEGGKHEGRGSWTFARYLADTDYAGKTNAFWDKIKGRLDFQKYCETNGYEGIDYFLIALGTNDVSQGTTLYRTEAEVQKFVDQAKQFIDALLDKETGFPNCKIGIGLCGPGSDYSYQCGSSMGIFHMSINTLNLALIKAFDAGKYRKNVTCFAHGLRTDRRLAFPYSDKPVTNRFTETSRTLTNSIHPSGRGYQAWADGYYCQIRAWLTEDSK